MKKTVFVQNVPHYPTAWGDWLQNINLTTVQKGVGVWSIREYYQTLHYWSKQNFNLCIEMNKDNPKQLILDHFFAQNKGDRQSLSTIIDMQIAFDYLDADPKHRWCAFGMFFNPDNFNLGHTTISQRSNWIGRESNHRGFSTDEEIDKMLDSKFFYLTDPSVVHDTSSNIHTIIWFVMVRAADVPIYFIVPNPDLIGVSPRIDDTKSDDVRYHLINQHFGTVGDTIFRPSFSNNVIPLTPDKIVAGDKFHITPFEHGIFSWGYQEQFPKVNLKVHTNLNYQRDPNTNKITFEFNPGQDHGYLQIKWNSGTTMDLTQSSPSLDNIENKCKITLDVYKDSKYKYKEGN
jgi:hypothetical protein